MLFKSSSPHWGPVEFVALSAAFAESIGAASQGISTYSPVLDRDLVDLQSAKASKTCQECRKVLLGGTCPEALSEVEESGLRAIYFGAQAEPALQLGSLLGDGRVAAVGLSDYTREQRDRLRCRQRLLPLHELDMRTALLTALDEAGGSPLLISVNLDLFNLAAVPEVETANFRGLDPEDFLNCLDLFPGAQVVGFHLWGSGSQISSSSRTSLLGAEILRDAVLTWWGV